MQRQRRPRADCVPHQGNDSLPPCFLHTCITFPSLSKRDDSLPVSFTPTPSSPSYLKVTTPSLLFITPATPTPAYPNVLEGNNSLPVVPSQLDHLPLPFLFSSHSLFHPLPSLSPSHLPEGNDSPPCFLHTSITFPSLPALFASHLLEGDDSLPFSFPSLPGGNDFLPVSFPSLPEGNDFLPVSFTPASPLPPYAPCFLPLPTRR